MITIEVKIARILFSIEVIESKTHKPYFLLRKSCVIFTLIKHLEYEGLVKNMVRGHNGFEGAEGEVYRQEQSEP